MEKDNKLKVFLSGQKWFGYEVFMLLKNLPFVEIVGVCAPTGDRLGELAQTFDLPIVMAGNLRHDTMPDNVDLGITAHSFDYIGGLTRFKTRLGWIGYHPSLLPRHRGRASIEWAIRMRDIITGGTVFWLNSGIDRGDIACQDWVFVDPKLWLVEPKKAAKILWETELQEMGLTLLKRCLNDIKKGNLIKIPQDKRFSTFEPNTDKKDIFKPDLLMLEQYAGGGGSN